MRIIGALAVMVVLGATLAHLGITALGCSGENSTCGGSGTARYQGHIFSPDGRNAKADLAFHFLSLKGSQRRVEAETDNEGRFCVKGPRERGPVLVEVRRLNPTGTSDARFSDPEIRSALEMSASTSLQGEEGAKAALFYQQDGWLRLVDGPSTSLRWEPAKDAAPSCVRVKKGSWLHYEDRWQSTQFLLGLFVPVIALLLLLVGGALGKRGRALQVLGLIAALATPILLITLGG